MPTPGRDAGSNRTTSSGRKPKKKPARRYTLPKTYKPEATTRRAAPKKGPPSPQRTGRATRPQPVTRRRDAPPVRTDRLADAKRTPRQKQHDRRVVAETIKQARREYVKRTSRGPSLAAVIRTATGGASTKHAVSTRPGLPGATVEAVRAGTISGTIPFRAAQGIGVATYRSPKGVAVGTAKGARDVITGLPSGLTKAAVETYEGVKEGDPLRGARTQVKAYKKDLERRYGPLAKGHDAEFIKRIEKEGATGEILDASILASGPAGATGRAAGAAARAGKLGSKAKRLASEPRVRARVTGGESKKQALSDNLVVAARQKAADRRRLRSQARRVRKADEKGGRVDAVLREAVERGEVVPRRAKSKQRRVYAEEKGRDLARMKREQQREVDKGHRKAVGGLSKDERLAFKYAMQLGLPADPRKARAELKVRLESILRNREAEGVDVPKTRRDTNDEVVAIRKLIERSETAFTPKLRETVKGEERRNRRVAASDPGLAPEQTQLRRYAAQAAHLGIERKDGESSAQFLRRVKKAAVQKGLERPGYFPSEKRLGAGYSGRAIGGARAVADSKAYTGALFRTGREDIRPVAFEQSLARSIKRKYNWNLVAKTFDRHSFEWGRNKTVNQLLDEVDRRGIDPDTVALWNPRRYKEQREAFGDNDAERTGRGEEPAAQGVGKGVDESALTLKDLAARSDEFKKTSGWSIVPREVFDEIHADTRPSGVAGRTLDIVKGKQARILLGLSPAWLQYQVASNALLTGLAGTGPVDFVKAQVWWNKLSDAEKDAVEPYVGIGTFQDSVQQTKLGAAKTRSDGLNNLIDSYRAFKQTPFMQKLARGNPLDALFRVDNAQNNAFRRSVIYSQVKRDAYKRMGENAKAMGSLQARLENFAKLGPQDRMRAIINDQEALEKHAEHVNDFLGDYTTYTAKERRYLQRNVMFYGFLRYSLRFAFYTMPVKHPLMSSIIGQIGRMQTDEVRKLLGGDELPWALGKLYFTKDGKLKSVDLSRANPASNALTDFRTPKDALGFLPPMFVAALDQAYSKTSFRDRPFRVRGETQGRLSGEYSGVDRLRVFTDQMLSLAAPYRALEKATQSGPQGDDSLLFSERPTVYKRADIVKSISDQEAKRPKSLRDRLMVEFTPLVPREDRAPEIASSIRQRNMEKAGQKKPAAKDGFKWSDGGGSKSSAGGWTWSK